jgi:hypothetical protein
MKIIFYSQLHVTKSSKKSNLFPTEHIQRKLNKLCFSKHKRKKLTNDRLRNRPVDYFRLI